MVGSTREFEQLQQAGGGSLALSSTARRARRWCLQNLQGYLLCVCEGVRAARHVLRIVGFF